MPQRPVIEDRLDSWKEIAAYIGRNVRTVIRWEKQLGLPVHRMPGDQRHAVYAWRREIDEWLQNGDYQQRHSPNRASRPARLTSIAVNTHKNSNDLGISVIPAVSPPLSRKWLLSRRLAWSTAVLFALSVGMYMLHSLAFPPRIQFTSVVQLTNDGALKEGLVTDGRTLYFGEHLGSKIVLASTSVDGGPVRTISTPFQKAIPADISPDGSNLLVLVREGVEAEYELWIVPVIEGEPKQLGSIHCHAAAWSPDGHKIAFASQNGIFMTTDEGESIRQIQSFDTTPEYLLWSRDGRRLRFELWDSKRPTFSFWELTFNDQVGTQISSLVPLNSALGDCWGRSMTLDESGRSLLGGGVCGKEKIYLLEKHQFPWNSHFELLETNSKVRRPSELALDPRSNRVFAISDSAVPNDDAGTERLDLFRIGANALEFKPFLPGIFATDVDFSRDGAWIAYICRSDQTLWISHSDGTSPRRVEFPASHFELPRWSPDGKWIAFMAQRPGKPWRIFVFSADGGSPHEASVGADNQGAPTWAPDGKWIVYGNVECEATESCAIHKLNISTKQEFKVPGSEGLGTARWSPDGNYFAALNPVSHEISVFDLKSERWRKLFDGVNGNDLAWSADSRYIYASMPTGNQPEILRIALRDSHAEIAVDLRSFAALSGRIDTWFTVAPDGSIVFSREMGSNEIYALAYDEK